MERRVGPEVGMDGIVGNDGSGEVCTLADGCGDWLDAEEKDPGMANLRELCQPSTSVL